LVCHRVDRQRALIEAIVDAVEKGRIPRSRIDEANARLDAFERRFVKPASSRVAKLGSPEHRALSQGLAAAAVGVDPTEVRV